MKTSRLFPASWIILLILFSPAKIVHAQTTQFQAVNDTIDVYPFVSKVFDILANDTIPSGDTIWKISFFEHAHHVKCLNDSNKIFTFQGFDWGYHGMDSCLYRIILLSGDTSIAKLIFYVHDHSYGYLNINNVNARFSASANHFFDEDAEYEVPKGSGKNTIFSNSLWIGGKDGSGNLHFAGYRYGQGPLTGSAHTKQDFYAGPMMDLIHYSIFQDTVWNCMWNLKKSEIGYHRAHYWETGYSPIHDILSWPGNGDTSLGQSHKLAPFSDRNGDGLYDPYDGDYPEIRGDQALFFIFNDDRGPHLESEGEKLRIEIHGMAYAFDMPEDSALKNTVFLHYKIYNRSLNTYDSVYIGVFTDLDLGYPEDDRLGCDVERNIYYAYNGRPIDGFGEPGSYGTNPPVQAVNILAGPYMDPDGIDNPRFDDNGNQICDYSVNGINFEDLIVDNERYGLTGFVYINNSNSGVPYYMTDPDYAYEYYQIMHGLWKDGTGLVYGGNGHPAAGGYGPACRFMYPGESDSLDWGAGCQALNGSKNWTEETAGNNPHDRRGVGNTGPFTFYPGDVQEIDISFIWARDYTSPSPTGSLDKLRTMVDKVNMAFRTNTLPNGQPFSGIPNQQELSDIEIHVFPNPASDLIHIEFRTENYSGDKTVDLLTLQGATLKRIHMPDNQKTMILDLTGLPTGLYLLKVKTKESMVMKKILVIR